MQNRKVGNYAGPQRPCFGRYSKIARFGPSTGVKNNTSALGLSYVEICPREKCEPGLMFDTSLHYQNSEIWKWAFFVLPNLEAGPW